MNKQELQGAFSKIHASDDLSRKVLSVEKDQKKVGFAWRPAVRVATSVAVVAALLLTVVLWRSHEDGGEPGIVAMPGIIQAFACEMTDPENETVLVNYDFNIAANAMINNVQYPTIISEHGLGMKIMVDEQTLQDSKITFDLSCQHGSFYTWEKMEVSPHAKTVVTHGQAVSLENEQYVYWRAEKTMLWTKFLDEQGGIYINVIVRADEHIVGYAIFEIVAQDELMQFYGIAMRESVYYPKVDGQFQEITEEYVQSQMDTEALTPMTGNEIAMGGVYLSARDPVERVDCLYMSICHGIRYTCHVFDQRYADREITFDISMNDCRICVGNKYYTEKVTLPNNTIFFVHGYHYASADQPVLLDVVIRADGKAIGYAVIKIGQHSRYNPETGVMEPMPLTFAADSCYSFVYPPVNGQLPEITEEEILQQLESHKAALLQE